MRARIAINDQGMILGSDGETIPNHGFLVLRKKNVIHIHMEAVPSYAAIVVMLHTLRAIRAIVHLHQPHSLITKYSVSEFCVLLGQRGLQHLQKDADSPFRSQISLFRRDDIARHDISKQLAKIGLLEVRDIASATTLMQASAFNNPNLVVVAPNRLMRFFFIALPPECDWPVIAPRTHFPIDEECDELTARWLTLPYETALATKAPLFQHGSIKLSARKTVAFHRIIVPISPASDRPTNYRILSLASCPNDPDFVII